MPEDSPKLPAVETLCTAVRIYLEFAYPAGAGAAGSRLPTWVLEGGEGASEADVAAWLGSEVVEREPGDASAGAARALAVRLGNFAYPHMKLRMARPPRQEQLLFSVDSHDGFLTARAESDAGPLEELKRHNAELARRIQTRWDEAGVPTEGAWLRSKVDEAQRRGA